MTLELVLMPQPLVMPNRVAELVELRLFRRWPVGWRFDRWLRWVEFLDRVGRDRRSGNRWRWGDLGWRRNRQCGCGWCHCRRSRRRRWSFGGRWCGRIVRLNLLDRSRALVESRDDDEEYSQKENRSAHQRADLNPLVRPHAGRRIVWKILGNGKRLTPSCRRR